MNSEFFNAQWPKSVTDSLGISSSSSTQSSQPTGSPGNQPVQIYNYFAGPVHFHVTQSTPNLPLPLESPLAPSLTNKEIKLCVFIVDWAQNDTWLDVQREANLISRECKKRISIIIHPGANFKSLCRNLERERPQVVHISTHGNDQGLIFQSSDPNGRLKSGQDVADKMQEFGVETALLSACYSHSYADELTSRGINVVAMDGPVNDGYAKCFSIYFYRELDRHGDVRGAFAAAKSEIERCGYQNIYPVLSMADTQLVPVATRQLSLRSRNIPRFG